MQRTISEWVSEKQEYYEDPFVLEGSFLKYKQEHSFIVKIQEKPEIMQTLKDTELLTVKIAIEEEYDIPKTVRIELTSDTEIYFNFVFECNDWEFKRIKANQGFFIQFKEYPEFIFKNFQKLQQKDKYFAVFTIYSQTQGKMAIIRKSQFKDDSIMEFDFVRAPEEQIRRSIQYRYNVMRKQYDTCQGKYESVCEVIRAKNPSLMIQVNKMIRKKL